MSHRTFDTTTRFDRFGWYWQPEQWLTEMSPADVRKATGNAVDLDELEKTLQDRVEQQKQLVDSFTQHSAVASRTDKTSDENP
ncbi:hypothetical protein [Gynuella sunshinyii]|uniref:Uncharacterized protein n=1 Tax=Gynuella sunshinyii YC6258 TaxID=1445510 RepID=A0A0C5W5F1_9GAMM|nr:hypothetical protein [Gynuella sunshinyii]AJQ97819.1 hypothetical Protein YC6258_05791 [Gynuella sunshinyii YC6258]